MVTIAMISVMIVAAVTVTPYIVPHSDYLMQALRQDENASQYDMKSIFNLILILKTQTK
jgi:hypothetical protein